MLSAITHALSLFHIQTFPPTMQEPYRAGVLYVAVEYKSIQGCLNPGPPSAFHGSISFRRMRNKWATLGRPLKAHE